MKLERKIVTLKEKELYYREQIEKLEQSVEKNRRKLADTQLRRAELEAQLAELS